MNPLYFTKPNHNLKYTEVEDVVEEEVVEGEDVMEAAVEE